MSPYRAKKIAEEANYFFYYDNGLRLWACYPKDLSQTAEYWTRAQLEPMNDEEFKEWLK